MERFFTPVHGSSEDEVKTNKHYQPITHRHPHNYHYHHNQYPRHGSHSHSSSSSHGKHRDSHHRHDNRHHTHHQGYSKMAGAHQDFTKTSSSSLSSSSCPTSSASWTSEPSLDDETYLIYNKPQHSLSCSNISEVQQKICEDLEFDNRDPLHLQNQKQRHSLEHSGHLLTISQHGHRVPKLCRGHSKSEEGLQQTRHRDLEETHSMETGGLYKTVSLGHSLAISANVEKSLGGRGTPKKAVSYIQIPSKGILKNKDEGQNRGNFRKSKSMEVLSTRINAIKTSKQSIVEAAKHNIVKGKLKFSAFLDEITRQVISPSTLSSLGVTPPKSPNEERKQYAEKLKHEIVGPSPKPQPVRSERRDSGKTAADFSTCSRTHKKFNYSHHRNPTDPPSPPPRHQTKVDKRGFTSYKQHHRQYSQLLTDGTSTSPEPIQKHKERHQSSHGPTRHLHAKQEHKSSSLPPVQTPGLSISPSSEKSDKSKHVVHRRHSRTQRDSASAADTVQFLEQYNKELHENLLQMVSCIENMEAELQCTKTELVNFKEKYKRLQESYSVSQQTNSVLEKKLKSMVDSLDSERKFLLQRVVDLTNQLDTAQKTISSLENINVPSLIRELLKKPFDSREALKNMYLQTFLAQSDTDQSEKTHDLKDSQLSAGNKEERGFEWPGQKRSDSRQQPCTAFLPWKHDHDSWAGPDPFEVKGSDSQLPFSVTDAVPKTTTDAKSQTHQANEFGMRTEFHSVAMTTHSCDDVSPNPYKVNEMRPSRLIGGDLRDESLVTIKKDPYDFTYPTAQRMLDNFLSQMSPQAHDDKEKDSLEAVIGAKKQAEGNQ